MKYSRLNREFLVEYKDDRSYYRRQKIFIRRWRKKLGNFLSSGTLIKKDDKNWTLFLRKGRIQSTKVVRTKVVHWWAELWIWFRSRRILRFNQRLGYRLRNKFNYFRFLKSTTTPCATTFNFFYHLLQWCKCYESSNFYFIFPCKQAMWILRPKSLFNLILLMMMW